MKVLLLGGGGREHALAMALSRDPAVTAIHAAPGNPGIGRLGALHQVDPTDAAAVATLAGDLAVDLVVVGPEAPLVAGVADAVRAAGVPCFGPSAEAARIEGSKAFAKEVMTAAGVPTADARVCESPDQVAAALEAFGAPYVVKDDGLAAGKGVVVTDDREAAVQHAKACGRVVVEEYLDGPEVSLFALTDGETVYPLQPAQDFKRALDGDQGPNTGGMGAYSPLPWAPQALVSEVQERVLAPTVRELARRGAPFQGLLYAGLALTTAGVRVVEFNARFGDPETQALLPRLESPLGELLLAAAQGRLASVQAPRWRDEAAVTVVVAADGYPDAVRTGDRIEGLDSAEEVEGVDVVQAGTRRTDEGLVTSGGRVLAVTGVGADLREARRRAYEGVGRIRIAGASHRSDIAAGLAGGPATGPERP